MQHIDLCFLRRAWQTKQLKPDLARRAAGSDATKTRSASI
jgi:hypothetical protein